jgi:hypothetical protein
MQRTIMDLESCNRQNFYENVFPQRYLPESSVQSYADRQDKVSDAATMIMSDKMPILVAPGEVVPGVIMPDSGSLRSVREEITDLKRELYDAVGLMLSKETRQVESAQAKAFDHLDVSALMRCRAETLEEGETEAVEISKAFDPSFDDWVPEYTRDFDVPDFGGDVTAIVDAMSVSLPDEVMRVFQGKLYRTVAKMGSGEVDEETEMLALEAIAAFSQTDAVQGFVNPGDLRQ